MVSKRCLLDTFSFCNGLVLNSVSFSLMASLSSEMSKKVWFLSAAMIHLSAMSTADSTFALSLGFFTLAGMTAAL
ncbi:MAG: hypothetical protein A4E58_01547 [Syntrophorhabdus sp. PtaB.Bin006]|nr:MAG: hypothetical protein A4E58_01547 [Syntrophorhabdus sp. PtaB.Bin006]